MAPLNGKCISYTGVVSDRIDIVETAIKGLGASISRDIGTRQVDYLIVAKRFSPKYSFCVANGIPILSLNRFLDVYKRYAMGEEPDSIETACLPTFEGLRVTMSRMDPTTEQVVSQLIENNGGEFKRALTRDCDIVLSSSLTGKKIKFAQQWQIPVVHPDWVFKSVSKNNALDPADFATETYAAAPEPEQQEEIQTESLVVDFTTGPKRASDWDDLFVSAHKRSAPIALPKGPQQKTMNQTASGMFCGLAFATRNFDDRQERILRKTVTSHDGSFLPPFDYIIVNSKNPGRSEAESVPQITEWAIERSLDRKCAMFDAWGQPVYNKIPTFQGVKICLSGFKTIELVHMERLVGLVGAELCSNLTIDRDVLVAASADCSRFRYAKAWNIPVVSEKWLWDCARDGKVWEITKNYALDGKGDRPAPQREAVGEPMEALVVEEPQNQEFVGYGSDEENEATPVGRDFVAKSVPVRRSKRNR